ncbi:uracil-DNA glycosylase [Methanosarcina sp. 2.H.T.1A.6]|uniref:uracil-DNA glycosylase family protein n=1 Tax=unclassified Methanosarcina TaxID=2644672 RepID=UPI000621D228|nr:MULTISPECIES: uracil-DNA glycosylase family protein [unclassified Methanosarcina]KKG15304.1 uracil-DNA glycosylase [Methanosarcina sp. 2.H.T.1A.3]KKG20143.1 uracil-DNA glycosylase [Methanosarcina sp. 2.H.T.1A.6]KKG23561.1 uracil-DNA glycosylase [Methanosarcina sp. 2.H.T.1A.8]KKG25308.1 uracil-DNA glycosylase [Methanosarcina sp. 2.H.T.1A.15]
MQMSKCVGCREFPCADVKHENYIVPDMDLNPEDISIVLISEAAPENPDNYYYSGENSLFEQTTVQAFNDAGVNVSSIRDILKMGIYLTTAVKCGKTGYGIKAGTIKECSLILEKELSLFPNVEAFLLMGDVAIKAVNYIASRNGEGKVIPAGSTCKLRGKDYFFRGKRAFPSYLQAGPSFFIEKSKRKMIAEDIAAALNLIR